MLFNTNTGIARNLFPGYLLWCNEKDRVRAETKVGPTWSVKNSPDGRIGGMSSDIGADKGVIEKSLPVEAGSLLEKSRGGGEVVILPLVSSV